MTVWVVCSFEANVTLRRVNIIYNFKGEKGTKNIESNKKDKYTTKILILKQITFFLKIYIYIF